MPAFDQWLPLSPLEELGWRIRIEGSLGLPEREFNGAVRGWQEIYRDGLAALGDDFAALAETDPDPHGGFWDIENLWCADSSVFPTSTGYNPTLTICALAHRLACHLVGDPLPPTSPRSGGDTVLLDPTSKA